ncbi:MAG: alpha/beta hydrolase [Pseudomonadota bacterium]
MGSNKTSAASTASASTAEDRIFAILGGILRAANMVSSRFASRLLYWLWCHPIRHKPSARELQFKRGAERSGFSVNGVGYKLYSLGQGPAVLLMHGWDGRATQMMAFARPLVEAGFRVVMFDAHGHGEAPGQQTNGVIISDMVVAAAKQVGGFYGLVAHSMGGSFALVALEQIGIERIVLIAPPQSMQTVYGKIEKRLGIPAAPGRMFRDRFARDFPDVWNRFSIEQIVPRLAHVKGLVVQDVEDDFVLPDESRAVHAKWPGAELFLTEGFGHRKILRAEPVVRKVVEFMKEPDHEEHAPAVHGASAHAGA